MKSDNKASLWMEELEVTKHNTIIIINMDCIKKQFMFLHQYVPICVRDQPQQWQQGGSGNFYSKLPAGYLKALGPALD